MLMDSRVKLWSLFSINEALQLNGIAAFPQTTEANGDLF